MGYKITRLHILTYRMYCFQYRPQL